MGRLNPAAQALWLGHVANPFGLTAPTAHFQRAIIAYDKQLRLFPSQVEPVYRLARICRRESRLGLNTMVVHDHPDTRICIQEGVLPICPLLPWAVGQPELVLRDLRARDTWLHGGIDPEKAIDKIAETMDRTEQQRREYEAKQGEEEFDERSAMAYRWLRYGPPSWNKAPAEPTPGQDGIIAPVPHMSELSPLPAFGSVVAYYGDPETDVAAVKVGEGTIAVHHPAKVSTISGERQAAAAWAAGFADEGGAGPEIAD